ncbi:YifB family Mg chelatase-like AAA ATPase [Helicobacter sp. 11S02596-1]|uniref:YifB family Mg chelatase-like AAA ATPase n=1 Tax=Helicobacter sp. 11S02596-1 TaxID=1476194 RepID=UPI000BA7D96D|nr:YifB family Mg chelatase-like AAA ATPase [Helicobacter sp. 11S02596-1]PAF43593.1 Fis family transcriptional regulator [Helicobacter sp. 11S02596-1]
MVNKILCATKFGTSAKIVEVEATFSRALPGFVISGLVNNAIQEARQRVHSALQNNNFTFPPLKIIVNLSPSDLPKNGSHFDLPIAILIALQKENIAPAGWFAFGELGLDGKIKHNDNIYPLLLDIALKCEQANVIVPRGGKDLFCLIPNLNFYYADHINEALEIIKQESPTPDTYVKELGFPCFELQNNRYYHPDVFELDFSEVKGQEIAKRAALIAASGFHNIIFEGSPGCGKSMIAKRMRYILPPLTIKEMIESVKLQTLSNQEAAYSPLRSFRNPHQSASKSSILGSATQTESKPGEIALAHNGILFFDELPHFKKDILESLREPLENNKLVVSRVHSKIEYDTSFLFIGAQNPCPCGNLLSKHRTCRCLDKEITAYKNHLSEPFMDRIDLFIQMNETQEDAKPSVSSKQMQEQVFQAFKIQISRGQKNLNGKLGEKEIDTFCVLDPEAQSLLSQANARFGFSERSVHKLKKLSRTIADLENSETIKKHHLLEALSYRKV